MCLPTCPTYVETQRERHSPRGRIALMRAIADGTLELSESFGDEMYYCLGCLACQTACPAGVDYATLFESARSDIEQSGKLSGMQREFWRWLTLENLFRYPRALRTIGWFLRLYQRSGVERLVRKLGLTKLLPPNLRQLEPQTPRIAPQFSDSLIAYGEAPPGTSRYRVGMLTGCVQDLVFSDVNRDTVDVLLANGCEVITPRVQSCCGSLHGHIGESAIARELARRQLDTFDVENLDAIITNAGGCGSHLKHYGHFLDSDPVYAERAKIWDRKVKDVHEWLVEIGFRHPESGCGISEVTYHESCHLCHGQQITHQPREILQAIPGLTLTELPESNACCGSAGIYNITQPEQSAKLLEKKLLNLQKTGVHAVATSNPGCHLQLTYGIKEATNMCRVQVTQPVTLLARAYRAENTSNKIVSLASYH